MVAKSEILRFKVMHLNVTLKKGDHDISDFKLRVLKKKQANEKHAPRKSTRHTGECICEGAPKDV